MNNVGEIHEPKTSRFVLITLNIDAKLQKIPENTNKSQ